MKNQWLQERTCSESGANAVEFALISVFLVFPLIFGGITAAWAWNTQQTLSHAAREGARFGATLPNPQDDGLDPDDPTWEERVEARTLEEAHGLDPDAVTICVHYADGGNDDTCFDDDLEGPRVKVQIETPPVIFSGFLPERWSQDWMLRSNAAARHEE